jgi:hypothetical protein
MNSIEIDILNPKASKLLEDLADLNLITIRKKSDKDFFKLIKKFRTKAKNSSITMEDITKEVELVRAKRYAKANG